MSEETKTSNWTAARVLAGIGAVLPAVYASLFVRTNSEELITWVSVGFVLMPLTFAGLCLWFAFRGHCALSRARMKYALIGGVAIGGIAFLGGVVGPMLFAPEANQGPLLGILITGPAGFVAGAWLGALYGFIRVRARRPPPIPDHG